MIGRVSETIGHIAHRWNGVNRGLLRPLFPLLAEGRPVPLDALSGQDSRTEVRSQLVLAGADFNDAGCIVGLGGIALTGGSHVVDLGRTSLSTCCAITAHTVPILLQRPAIIRSRDPATGRGIVLSVDSETARTSQPEAAVAGFIVLDAPQQRQGLCERFCNYVRYFEGARTASAHDFGQRSFLFLSPPQVHEAARLWVQLVWN